jgi:hypothetical protein
MGSVSTIFEHKALAGPAAPILALARVPGLDPQKCVILHYAREGACVSSGLELPDYFVLRAIDSRIERMCRVVWRDEQVLGVAYINARTMGRSSGPVPQAELSDVIALFPT